jgi:hypothetical protein
MKKIVILLFIFALTFSLALVSCDVELSHDHNDHHDHDHDGDGIADHSEEEHDLYLHAQEYCSVENVVSVYVCGEYIKTVSRLLGGGVSYHQLDVESFSCPVVAPEYVSESCAELADVSCKEICSSE